MAVPTALPLRALLFDLDDTLVMQAASDRASLVATAARAGEHGVDAERLASAVAREAERLWRTGPAFAYCDSIGISWGEGLWARFDRGADPNLRRLRGWAPTYRREAWGAGLRACGVEDAALARRLAMVFTRERRSRHVVYEETEDVLRRLQGRVRLGLLTNGAPCLQREKIEGSGLAEYFDTIVVSGDHGIGKPDPRVFELALQGLGADGREAAMVGDNPARDVLGARNAGLRSVWLNRDVADGLSTARNHGVQVEADYEIRHLGEIERLFGL